MFAMPDAVQLVELAAPLNLHLSRGDAELYLPFIRDAMRELDAFVQSRADEAAPPRLFPERGPGYRPSPAEDRYQAWLWKCAIGGQDRGLLAGRTVSFKDHISVAGIPQVFTSQALEGFVPDVDATVASRVLAAGGKIAGKHMMNGFMGDYGKPLNPHNPARITGGSSSGSGAALAAGEVDISFGGDQGGSIRLPAAYCGVVGLKPTFGLVSHFAVGFAAEPSVDHVGPMARTVADVAAALQAVADTTTTTRANAAASPRASTHSPTWMAPYGGCELAPSRKVFPNPSSGPVDSEPAPLAFRSVPASGETQNLDLCRHFSFAICACLAKRAMFVGRQAFRGPQQRRQFHRWRLSGRARSYAWC